MRNVWKWLTEPILTEPNLIEPKLTFTIFGIKIILYVDPFCLRILFQKRKLLIFLKLLDYILKE